jgi:hypothetical protein
MYKLGKKSRKFCSKVPHMSSILGNKKLSPPPISKDWTNGQTEFGMMLNSDLGDCAIASIFHIRQILTLNSSTEKTESDPTVLKLYEEVGNYVPNDPSTDNGCCLQDVLNFCSKTGFPLDNGTRERFLGFIEVDIRNTQDIRTTINDFGVCYLGIQVPASVWSNDGEPLKTWDVGGNSTIEGGHAITGVAYDEHGVTVISWGELYKLTWAFIAEYADEAYAIVSQDWLNSQNTTPLGMSEDELASLLEVFKED